MRPLIAGLGRSERRVAAARYVEGLLMPGHRKSIGRMPEAHWKRFGWWWAGRRVIPHPIAITWSIFIGPWPKPDAWSWAAPAGILNSTCSAPRLIWGWITLRAVLGGAFTTT